MADPTTLPVAIVCVGMAGSGKTTFMQRINSYLYSQKQIPYVINLDPAVRSVPFDSNIDIRDSVNYKEVMKQYNLGPNGGILTSLNLFATKIDQILALLEKRTAPPPPPATTPPAAPTAAPPPALQKPIKHILVDTPGQIEVFVWSASGDILLNSLASSFPTVIAYIIDTPRTTSTSTFMSNMLYACSILYKTKLPMILVFNKTDAQDAEFAKEWMTDFEAFQEALRKEEEGGSFGGVEGGDGTLGGGSGYLGSLLNSMSLVLEEFYRHLSVVGVSAMTGDGVEEFFKSVQDKKEEFIRDYQPELERRRKQREKDKGERRERELGRLLKDMNVSGSQKGKGKMEATKDEPETVSDAEDMEEEEQEGMMLDDDENDDDDEGEDMESGLEQRYQQALKDNRGGEGGPSGDDFSFARYMHKANLG